MISYTSILALTVVLTILLYLMTRRLSKKHIDFNPVFNNKKKVRNKNNNENNSTEVVKSVNFELEKKDNNEYLPLANNALENTKLKNLSDHVIAIPTRSQLNSEDITANTYIQPTPVQSLESDNLYLLKTSSLFNINTNTSSADNTESNSEVVRNWNNLK